MGAIDHINVRIKPFIPDIFDERYTTQNDGVFVTCDEDPYLNFKLRNVVKEWRNQTEYSDESEEEEESSDDDYWY